MFWETKLFIDRVTQGTKSPNSHTSKVESEKIKAEGTPKDEAEALKWDFTKLKHQRKKMSRDDGKISFCKYEDLSNSSILPYLG